MFLKILQKNHTASAIIWLLALALVVPSITTVKAESIDLPLPSGRIVPSAPFVPIKMIGLQFYPNDPSKMDFLVDSGESSIDGDVFKSSAQKMIHYFLAALTVPADQMWVNLSPYEKDRIIPPALGMTDMGKDLLIQDYFLKQLSASLVYPESVLGRAYWNKVYAQAIKQYGSSNVSTKTFNKVWIVPDQAEVFVRGNRVFVTKSHLKVMLEKDYLAAKMNQHLTRQNVDHADEVFRQLVLPQIEEEVNQGKNFAPLRQMVQALILASWYKKNLYHSSLTQGYADKNKIEGIELGDLEVKEKIYSRYLEAFKKGVYNYVREDVSPETNMTVARKYFSGGFEAGKALNPGIGQAEDILSSIHSVKMVSVDLAQIGEESAAKGIDVIFSSRTLMDIKNLKPGQVMINRGRANNIEVIDGKVRAILDHHHLGNDSTVPRSASALIFKRAGELKFAGEIIEVVTNYNPDPDTIVAIMIIEMLRTMDVYPDYLPELVDYITEWDGGRISGKVEGKSFSLGMFIKGLIFVIDAEFRNQYFKEVIQSKYSLSKVSDIYSMNDLEKKKAILDEINEAKGKYRVNVVIKALKELYRERQDPRKNYRGLGKEFMVQRSDFESEEIKLYYDKIAERIKHDLGNFRNDQRYIDNPNEVNVRGQLKDRIKLLLRAEQAEGNGGKRTAEIEMPVFINPKTAEFYSYLYLKGEVSGIYYEYRQKDVNNIRNVPLDERITAKSISVAVSELAGVSVTGLAEYLSGVEIKKRKSLGLNAEPHNINGDKVFWKETLKGRKIQSMEGSVLTPEELLKVLSSFDPEKSVQAKLERNLQKFIKELNWKRKLQAINVVLSKGTFGLIVRWLFGIEVPVTLFGLLSPAILLRTLPVEIIIDGLILHFFIIPQYMKAKDRFVEQNKEMKRLIQLVGNFIFYEHMEDRIKLVFEMTEVIPKIEYFKPDQFIEAIDNMLAQQPLPVEFDEKLRELKARLIVLYGGPMDYEPVDERDGSPDKAMSAENPGGIDLSDEWLDIQQKGDLIPVPSLLKGYEQYNGLKPIIRNIVPVPDPRSYILQ